VIRRQRPAPPKRQTPQPSDLGLPALGVLEAFTHASLTQWRAAGKNLARFSETLFFDLERHRAQHSDEFVAAIRSSLKGPLEFHGWSRLVDYEFSNQPLSMEGSIKADGGRFNIGRLLNPATYTPFPALYVAEDFPTAFRERFGVDKTSNVSGLTATDLALRRETSFSNVALNIQLETLIDIGDLDSLKATTDILRRFQMSKTIAVNARRLRMRPGLVRTATGLQRQLLSRNWRVEPVQYDLPSNSQIFGRLCAAAGAHAILYPSTRDSSKRCLALFPQNWKSSSSRVELAGVAPPEVLVRRLDGSL
jgi:hypothetical protein